MRSKQSLVWPKRLHWDKYFRPQSIPEALQILGEFQGKAKLLAGGTDLILQIRNGEIAPKALVDITRIPGLDQITLEGGVIRIGPLVTHTQLSQSPLIREKATALSEGASQLGSPQIRNLGTVAGNIVSGQPGADTTIPLLSLDAKVKVVSKQGERTVPLTEFFLSTGKTVVDSMREMVTEIYFSPLAEDESSVSLRLAKRKALALPILTVSVVVSANMKQRKFNRVKIGLGPVALIPFRPREAEQMFASAPLTDKVIKGAARKAAQEANPRTSLLRGSETYRREVVANLVERGIRQGIERLEVKHG
ncbi:MAG: xanthine dehydrogenase family protein subunit M [Deltaproteobacteria bacterium]|nr:xanthine dehydrogenase family protein subunit M [Deltaproteobacteria bacterium]